MASWAHSLTNIRQIAARGQFSKAIDLGYAFLDEHFENLDARSWCKYELFCISAQAYGMSSAISYTFDILESAVNLGAKLSVASRSVAYFKAENDAEGVTGVATALDKVLSNFLGSFGGHELVEFPFSLVVRVAQQLSDAQMLSFCPLLGPGPEKEMGIEIGRVPAEATHFTVPQIKNAVPGSIRHVLASGNRAIQDLRVSLLSDCILLKVGHDLLVLGSDGSLYPYPYTRPLPIFIEKIVQILTGDQSNISSMRLEGRGLLISDQFNGAHNICHWTLDWLARIVVAQMIEPNIRRYIGSFALDREYEKLSMKRVGRDIDYIFVDNAKMYHCEELIICSNTGENLHHPCYGGHNKIISGLVNSIDLSRKGNGGFGKERGSRIYLPRFVNRKVINESDLVSLLREYQFEVLNTDAMSYDQQIKAFSAAGAIIAPHGAALTNMIFARQGCKILELFPKFGGSAAYFVLSSKLGFEYSSYVDLVSDPTFKPDPSPDVTINTASFVVDLSFVADWLRTL